MGKNRLLQPYLSMASTHDTTTNLPTITHYTQLPQHQPSLHNPTTGHSRGVLSWGVVLFGGLGFGVRLEARLFWLFLH